MITYQMQPILNILKVYVDKVRVGSIKKVSGGYRYFPKGSENGGELFQTIEEVKRKIEVM